MTNIKTGSGRFLRTEALAETVIPIPYDPAAMPGAALLGSDGQVYFSRKIGDTYQWGKLNVENVDGDLIVSRNIQVGDSLVSKRLQVIGTRISLIRQGETLRTPYYQLGGVRSTLPSDDEHRDATLCLVYSQGSSTPTYGCARARDNAGAPLAVQTSAALGAFQVYAWTGVEHGIAARLIGHVDTEVATGSSPGEWRIEVTPAGAMTPVRAMTVRSNGNVLIGNTTGTERLSVTGNVQVTEAANGFRVAADQVVGARRTGWTAPTGTATRAGFATSTATLTQVAETLKALIDDLTTHGLIGA
jgi:hypothetical protein